MTETPETALSVSAVRPTDEAAPAAPRIEPGVVIESVVTPALIT